MMKKNIFLFAVTMILAMEVSAQRINLPVTIDQSHPRLLTNAKTGREDLQLLLEKEKWALKAYGIIDGDVKPYVTKHQTDSTWIVSRLQMYWKTHCTDVFVKNGVFAYASGRAPVPTVRFTGTRDASSAYATPKLEDIKPYMDQEGKIYLQNKTTSGQPWEWVEQSKTGRIIESINISIINRARDAAMIYWYTGDEKYGKFAYDILDTYLTGMYYRNEPVDLNHGHDQTLLGLSAFEVIHEGVLEPLTPCYDFLYNYISKKHPEKLLLYSTTLKKWADIIIKNGVPFNNWDLIEARYVAGIALVLEDNKQYSDGRGCQYYLDQILNTTHTRQWALTDLLSRGYDPGTGIWSECPGYSVWVLGDFTGFVSLFDRTLKTDLLPQMPILPKAVIAQAQYLYPNGYIVGFGDTHYGRLPTNGIEDMIRNAQTYHKTEQEEAYTRMLKAIRKIGRPLDSPDELNRFGFNALFSNPPVILVDSVKAGPEENYLTPSFWAPNVSWMVQRNGLDVINGLMVSQAGSTGNHAHANGIAMELYGKGLILAPEGGIGGSYFQTDYAEYYSQFPAHNTVVVDGISAYPAMKSNHPLQLKNCYPESNQKSGYFKSVTFSDVYFLEPEANADQDRLMSIIRTSDTSGYYVDIFRSRKKSGGDKFHDYIYHNLGQQVILSDADHKQLSLQPTDKLTFANMELLGYDYWWDKKSVTTSGDFNARFDLHIPGGKYVSMNMWMKGFPQREIFSVKAPPSRSWRGNEIISDSIANMPLPTVVVRQNGEAWNSPFVSVFEPANGAGGSSVKSIGSFEASGSDSSFVGISIQSKNGITDYVMSEGGNKLVTYQDLLFKGSYGVVSKSGDKLRYLFLGAGYTIAQNGYIINATNPTSASLSFSNDKMYLMAKQPVKLIIPGKQHIKYLIINLSGNTVKIIGRGLSAHGKDSTVFDMPAMPLTELGIKI